MRDVDIGEAMHVWGAENIWDIYVPPSQFCCVPKTLPKKVSKTSLRKRLGK